MKHYLTLIFAFVTTLSFAAYPVGSRENIDGSVLGWDESHRCWRPIAVDATGQMKGTSTGDVVIASISVDTSKIEGYLNSTSAIHINIDSMATDTNGILNTLQGDVATDTVINRLGSIEDEVKDIRGVFGDGETTTDTIRGRLKSIDEKINGSSGASSWTSTQIENLLGAIGINDLSRYSSIVANLGDIYSQLTRTVDEAGIIDHFSVSEDLGAIRHLIKKNSEFPDDESTTDVDESDTDSITKILYDIRDNVSGGSSSPDVTLDIGDLATDTEKIREILKSDSDSEITESVTRILTDIRKATEDVYADTIAINTSSFTPLSDSDLAYASLDNASFKALAGSSSVVNSKTKRMFIEIRMPSDTDEFEISFNGTVYRPVKGRVLLEIRNDNLWIRVDTSRVGKVYITEGWK